MILKIERDDTETFKECCNMAENYYLNHNVGFIGNAEDYKSKICSVVRKALSNKNNNVFGLFVDGILSAFTIISPDANVLFSACIDGKDSKISFLEKKALALI